MMLSTMLILMVSCGEKKTEISRTDRDGRIPVKVALSEEREFTPSIELSGTAFAFREANLGAALPGRVEKLHFPEGSRVNKGDLLVSLSGELYTQTLVEFSTIEKDFERVSRLIEKGSVTQQEYDHVKAMYEAEKSKVEMLRKNAEITAPFSGTIVEYLVHEGENYFFNFNLDPGYSSTSGILRLMQLDPILVEVEVNEKELGKIKKGQAVLAEFDAVNDTLTGKVAFIKPVLSTLTHSATVKIEIRNPSGVIKPGMFAHVKIELSPIRSVFVPVNAIYVQPGTSDNYLFVVENNAVKRQKIEKIRTDKTWVAIEGIASGKSVVTSGKEKLRDGSLIEIR